MAISVTKLQGTNSIAADRITLNDNFATVVNETNNITGIVNVTTGKIDNTGVGSNNVIVTEGLTVTTDGIDITAGGLTLDADNIILSADSTYIQLGSGSSKIAHILLPKVSSGNFHAFDISQGFNLAKLPKLTTANIADIDTANLEGGEMVYDSDTNEVNYYNTVTWVAI